MAISSDDRPGPSRGDTTTGVPGTSEFEVGGILADLRRGQGFAGGAIDSGLEPRDSEAAGRMAQEAIADYAGWMAGGGDSVQYRAAAARGGETASVDGSAGAQRRERPAPRDEAEAAYSNGRITEGFDPREAIRRARGSSPAAIPAEDSTAEGRTTRPARGMAEVTPGQRFPEARLGGASTGAIERLLREQNDLIRQDLQRNTNPPIAAPPPMRGGGVRM